MSIILDVVGWAPISLMVLAMWLPIRASMFDPDLSGREAIKFLPLFVLMFIGPVNLTGDIIGTVGTVGRLATQKLN